MTTPYSTLPMAGRCRRCQIGIAGDEAEAQRLGIPFSPLVNVRVGELCIGCAGGDGRLEIYAELANRLLARSPKEIPVRGKRISDRQIKDVWARKIAGLTDAACIQAAADELDIKVNTLTGHLRRLDLAYPGSRTVKAEPLVAVEKAPGAPINGRLPYVAPSVATLPLNGNGKHAEVGRQMVAEAAVAEAAVAAPAPVGAQTLLGGDTVSPPKQEETAVLPAEYADVPILVNAAAFKAYMERMGYTVSGKVSISLEIEF